MATDTGIELSIIQGETCIWLVITLPAKYAARALQFERRGDGHSVKAALTPFLDRCEARLPLEALEALHEARWDVRLEYAAGKVEPLSLPPLPDEAERHFYSGGGEEAGISAYLTDSLLSLALYVAPKSRHLQVSQAENSRARYGRYLNELPLIDNLVFFESFLGKAYAGNPRYLYEALRLRRPDLQFVWSYEGSECIPGHPLIVNRRSDDYYRLLAQARYRVNNVLFPVHGKKPSTRYLQTWHGTPLKRLGFDIEIDGPEMQARENFFRESRSWDALLSANAFSSETLCRAFRYQGEVLEVGYPLADSLTPSQARRRALIESFGLPSNKRFVLYAPTWRDDQAIGPWQHRFDLQLDLERFAREAPQDLVLLIKSHHLVAERLNQERLPANVVDLSRCDDINELCELADVLITDYSSVFFDFAATGRPILFFCYDLSSYASKVRGFYLGIPDDLPGPVAQDNDELIAMLGSLDLIEVAYAESYAAFRQRFCSHCDGRSADRLIDAFFG
ncbi:CDP-glycerol glycerophosphotransferase family protein [Marinobacter sp.]|uniref:CDP-glycerol glycerophosphotransferase family protein n=1 Tax=Marinobacter sp. TaxID=50741 RepID=UPI003A933A28